MTSSNSALKNFIELHRTFSIVNTQDSAGDELGLETVFSHVHQLSWEDLLKEFRVVILSEAGSGKTYELMNTAEMLRGAGNYAFFMRLERLTSELKYAFDVGTIAEFQAWLSTNEEGWLFLDSVDEARLKSPRDFANALRVLGQEAQHGLDRAHIFISSRTSAWRPRTDVDLVESELPYNLKREGDTHPPRGVEDSFSPSQDIASAKTGKLPFPKVLRLAELSKTQIELYLSGRGLHNISDFLDAVTRANSWALTSRPQDLEELVDFWNANGRLGSRRDVLANSVARRLKEREQDRSTIQVLSHNEVYTGAQLLAAATTLCKTQDISIPDGSHEIDGIRRADLFGDWADAKYSALLERPIFHAGTYGAVRFHHRTVREYLAAEWFSNLLKFPTSRRRIETLFFCTQYDIDVVVPTLRPLLPWLALLDDGIQKRVLELNPSILLEGGDPSQLALSVRKDLIRRVCRQLNNGGISQCSAIFGTAGYLACDEITHDVVQAIDEYSGVEDVEWFLLQIIWQGKVRGALPKVQTIALDATKPVDIRRLALRTLTAIGSPCDANNVCQEILAESIEIDRGIVAEMVKYLRGGPTILDFSTCLRKSSEFLGTSVDDLTDCLISFGTTANLATLATHVGEVSELLKLGPYIPSQSLEISSKFYWLLSPLSKWIERLIDSRASVCLEERFLTQLHTVSQAECLRYMDRMDFETRLAELVPAWSELNRALFWHVIAGTRYSQDHDRRESFLFRGRVVGISVFKSFWRFETDEFDYFIQELEGRTQRDERAAALSVAFTLYKSAGRPRNWRIRLKNAVSTDKDLQFLLNSLLRPPRQDEATRSYKREEAKWKKEQERRYREAARNVLAWKKWFGENLEQERERVDVAPGTATNALAYLFEVQSAKRSSKSTWADPDWQSLAPEYGQDVAQFYRYAMVNFWRYFTPVLRSEGASTNSTPYPVIFGLIGLEIEASEKPDWPQSLSEKEASLACRYASLELNGFPAWFERLYSIFPRVVCAFLLGEIRFEVTRDIQAERLHYVLDDIVWSGKWLWDEIALELYNLLTQIEPSDLVNLNKILKILQHSSLPNEEIEKLAEAKLAASVDASHQPLWFAVLTGVAPKSSIRRLWARISELPSHGERVSFAMSFVNNLLGNSGNGFSGARSLFQTSEHLTQLYSLVHEFVRRDEDIDRTGGGAFHPGDRDTAQECRSQLFNLLLERPAKEAVLTLRSMANSFPDQSLRPVFAEHARRIAEQASEFDPWSEKQVREFSEQYERTPRNHKELAELAKLRLLDLKDDLENGDNSDSGLFWNRKGIKEIEVRNYVVGRLKSMALGRYTISSEDELADGKKPDIRFQASGLDGPVPVELKLANQWSGSKLLERLENQLCRDYLRDNRSNRGIFLLVYQADHEWKRSNSVTWDFAELLKALECRWDEISPNFPHIEAITIIGIDLSVRKAIGS